MSGWTPLRHPDFRRLWAAQFTSNVGSWMQTVAAQWVMISLTSSAILLSAIAAASSIPILVFAVGAGVLGDLVDRRALILASQALMLAAAVGLAVLSAVNSLTPANLLVLLVVIGIGGAASAPTWQTLQPELVPPADRPQAIALGAVNQNLARAVGPAFGGLLLAATSAALVFFANAVSFVAVLLAVAVTRIPARRQELPREHVVAATRAGGRYVGSSPLLLGLIVRSVAFVFPAGAIWALLPIVARHRLGLGSAGYGLLLGCVGVGALLAATFGPAVKRKLGPRQIYALSALLVAGPALVLALASTIAPVVVALVVAGAAWITCLGLLGAGYQGQLPVWVKARGMSYYLLAFQGANGIGALAFGTLAQASSVSTALNVLAAGLAVAAILTWWLPLPAAPIDVLPSEMPLPLVDPAVPIDKGPVAVNVTYQLKPDSVEEFLTRAAELRRMRRRTGAIHWHLHRDIEDANRFEELFVVGSWEEHERQHQRLQGPDRATLDQIDELLAAGHPRTARHLLGISLRHRA